MISFQGALLGLILRFRRRFVDWEAPVERFRLMVERSARLFKPPGDVTITPLMAGGVPCEWLTPPDPDAQTVVLYLHGGAWTLGWSNIHRQLVAQISKAAGSRALAVDYRLAPEHPFPAGLEDCVAVYQWLLKNGTPAEKIVIGGDSAGGNLTLATLLCLRDAAAPLPAAAFCIAPMTDLEGTGESFNTKRDPVVTAEFARSMVRHYAGGHDLRLPLLSPYHGDVCGLPPLLVQVGDEDILLSDAMLFADKARAAGVDVTLTVWPKMWHVWHLFTRTLPEARQAVKAVGNFIHEQLARKSSNDRT
jgi:monoterpene epsilon-lactone hydrolase